MAAITQPRNGKSDKDLPLPYRVLSKDYMAQQLPHLEEKAPSLNKVRTCTLNTINKETNSSEQKNKPHLYCISYIGTFRFED